MLADMLWYVAGTADALASAHQQHDAYIQQKDQDMASLLAERQAVQAQLEGQTSNLQQAESHLTAAVKQVTQVQSQHQDAIAHCEQLAAQVQSSSRQLQAAEIQLQDNSDALSSLQLQHTGIPSFKHSTVWCCTSAALSQCKNLSPNSTFTRPGAYASKLHASSA